MNLDIGSTLSRAWKITWENKILWIFGILAGLGGGGGGVPGGFGGGDGGGQPGGPGGPGEPGLPSEVERFFESVDPAVLTAIAVGVVCLALVIALVLIALSVIGRGGLIGGVQLAEASGKVTFGEAWSVGARHFWTLFLIGLVVGLITLALALVTIVPAGILTAVTMGLGAVCLIPLICILIVLAIVLGIIAYFAQIAAVVENLGVRAALSRAWEIIRANLGSIIVLGIILLIVGGVIGFVIALPIIAVVVPPFIGLATGDEGALRAGIIVAVLCFLAYLPVLLVLGGILQTWITAAWTLAYQQFTRPAAPPAPLPPVTAS